MEGRGESEWRRGEKGERGRDRGKNHELQLSVHIDVIILLGSINNLNYLLECKSPYTPMLLSLPFQNHGLPINIE